MIIDSDVKIRLHIVRTNVIDVLWIIEKKQKTKNLYSEGYREKYESLDIYRKTIN